MNKSYRSRYISKWARVVSSILFVMGMFFVAVGVYGYLVGDLNWSKLQPVAKAVFAARREARSFEIPISGSVQIFATGSPVAPIALISFIMNNAIFIFLFGVIFLLNAVMFRIQSWERMKDFFMVQPAIFFFLLFVYYPIIDLLRISFTGQFPLCQGI